MPDVEVEHKLIVGKNLHVPGFFQDTDPSIDPLNNIIAGKYWVDTTNGRAVLKIRNQTNTDWINLSAPYTVGPNPPNNPYQFEQWGDTNSGQLRMWNGTDWDTIVA